MHLINALLELLFPSRGQCIKCGRGVADKEALCRNCQKKLVGTKLSFCPLCGRYRSSRDGTEAREAAQEVEESTLCSECLKYPPPFFAARSLGPYGGELKEIIYLFKYRGYRSLASCLGQMLVERFLAERALADSGVLVPVPLSDEKLKQRGFNQSELLALEMGRLLNIPVRNYLAKVRDTVSQSKLTRESRRVSVSKAFKLRTGLKGERILLIDDIFTTGATASECSRVLLEGGAGEVGVITLASGILEKNLRPEGQWRKNEELVEFSTVNEL